jgi:ABC-type lipoprotein release transport system permease subunit
MIGGVIGSVSLSRVLESLLYGIDPTDPYTLVLASTGLLGTVLIAAVIPATRSVRIRPATALRME